MSQALTVRDIAAAIEDFAPKSLQESYDNAGLQVGNPDATVSGILLCLDVTEDIVCEAEERKCNLIVSHHPLLFKGLKEITGTTPAQRIVIEALRLGISIYSAHTNLDSAREGVSYEIAHILGLKSLSPLEHPPQPGLKKPPPAQTAKRLSGRSFRNRGRHRPDSRHGVPQKAQRQVRCQMPALFRPLSATCHQACGGMRRCRSIVHNECHGSRCRRHCNRRREVPRLHRPRRPYADSRHRALRKRTVFPQDTFADNTRTLS